MLNTARNLKNKICKLAHSYMCFDLAGHKVERNSDGYLMFRTPDFSLGKRMGIVWTVAQKELLHRRNTRGSSLQPVQEK